MERQLAAPDPHDLGQDGADRDGGGRWQAFNVASAANHCYGREVPIVVDSATDNAVTLKLKFSEALAGCSDVTVRLKRDEAGTFSGTRSGAPLTLLVKQ